MRRIPKEPVEDPELLLLIESMRVKTDALIEEFEKTGEVTVDDKLYKRFMPFLLRAHHDKCAYCESIIPVTHPGDVEHFRPKGRVADKAAKIMHKLKGEIAHPGYFWLAYEWKNLFPSCIDCNRRRYHGDDGEQAGKADIFPISGKRAEKPGDEAGEQPLLIDPGSDDPNEHLEFLPDGLIKPKTQIGAETIKVFGLNRREPLKMARSKAFADGKLYFKQYWEALARQDNAEETAWRDKVNEMWHGRHPYTAMQKLALETLRAYFLSKNINLTFPLA